METTDTEQHAVDTTLAQEIASGHKNPNIVNLDLHTFTHYFTEQQRKTNPQAQDPLGAMTAGQCQQVCTVHYCLHVI